MIRGQKKIELLAPGGDLESIKAAIDAGADAVYCGLSRFNARNRAENIDVAQLPGITRLAHRHSCNIFIALNIIIVESEIPALFTLLNRLVNIEIDGVIVQDLGLFYLLKHHFPLLSVHASTQLTTHNPGQLRFMKKLGAERVNLSREMSLQEIEDLSRVAHENGMLTEVFVHGSNCLSFSGLCYFSSVQSGNSGNRGRCSQPCRGRYKTSPVGKDYPLNLKDNCAFGDLAELAAAGVDSIKIEGRIKKFHYVAAVVGEYRGQLDNVASGKRVLSESDGLRRVFNRDFSNGYLHNRLGKHMFIDSPRDFSALYRAGYLGGSTEEGLEQAKQELYDEKTELIQKVRGRIEHFSIRKIPLTIKVSGKVGHPLVLTIHSPDTTFTLQSDIPLSSSTHGEKKVSGNVECLRIETIALRLKTINETAYTVVEIRNEGLQDALFLPYSVITSLKNKLFAALHQGREFVPAVAVPQRGKKNREKQDSSPSLAVLLSAVKDVPCCSENDVDLYFQLPESFAHYKEAYTTLFQEQRRLTPWFPAILLGEDYAAAVRFMHRIQPSLLVTDNSGIGYEACKAGIPWIAGPCLNSVNSYSLSCLKEFFDCSGAFLSTELKKQQLQSIRRPDAFKLFYTLYQPLELMVSRQCLFHQVRGCEKGRLDKTCLGQCVQSASISNLDNEEFFLHKQAGNYHRLYNGLNFMNCEVVKELENLFSGYCLDLRDVETKTTCNLDKAEIISLVQGLIGRDSDAARQLHEAIKPTTNIQYRRGI